MKNSDVLLHVTGRSVFLDDIPQPDGLLHAVVFPSPKAHGKIKKLDLKNAKSIDGIVDIFTYKDIPGENQIGGIIKDEVLLAQDHVLFAGEPIALVVGTSRMAARKALKAIKLEIDFLPVTTDPRDAYKKGELIIPPRTFSLGDTENAWKECDIIVEGQVESGSQEHFYMEPQSAMALPREGGGVMIYSSTQAPTAVQRITARVLGLPMHMVEVDVKRIGGGFGGKEDQATAWACLAALAAFKLNKPVKLVLDRREDITMTGKRHPYSSDFKIGLKKDGTIIAYEVMYYQNAGAAADLSTAILERTLFHVTNSYFIPNVKAIAASCRTNLPPFTAFRGFGGPQAMFVIESAIYKAAEALKIPASLIQQKNLLEENSTFPYGQKAKNCKARECWQELEKHFLPSDVFRETEEFNAQNAQHKKGVAIMPICFGISFTNTALNQAGSLVHIYTDGSVGISTAAIEMGQGVNMKIRHVAAQTFSISEDRIRIESTNTTRIANTSPTAASSGADLNGKATEIACDIIKDQLKKTAADILNHPFPEDIRFQDEKVYCRDIETDLIWEKLIDTAYWKRVNLSAHGFYATPRLHFDRSVEKGDPFAYHVFGTALIRVTLDCLRGTYTIDEVNIVHDNGKSLDLIIDKGQVEGGLLQGIGWMTMEEVIYSREGRLLTDSTSTYKVPDIKATPAKVDIRFLEKSFNPAAVLNSKAIGEPPFMYGIGVYFALLNAMRAFKPDKSAFFNSPITPEKILNYLYEDR